MKTRRNSAAAAARSVALAREWFSERNGGKWPEAIAAWAGSITEDSRGPPERRDSVHDLLLKTVRLQKSAIRLRRTATTLFVPPSRYQQFLPTMRVDYDLPPDVWARIESDFAWQAEPIQRIDAIQIEIEALVHRLNEEFEGLRVQWPTRKRGERLSAARDRKVELAVRAFLENTGHVLTATNAALAEIAFEWSPPTFDLEARRISWHRRLRNSNQK